MECPPLIPGEPQRAAQSPLLRQVMKPQRVNRALGAVRTWCPQLWPVSWSSAGVSPESLESRPACADPWHLSLRNQGLVGLSFSSAVLALSPVSPRYFHLPKTQEAQTNPDSEVNACFMDTHRFLVPLGPWPHQSTVEAFYKHSSISSLTLWGHVLQVWGALVLSKWGT